LWWERGADHSQGGFYELLGQDGLPPPNLARRARVQSRPRYVYATAGMLGWSGPWREAAPQGLDYLDQHYRRSDGQYCTLVSHDGAVLDETTLLYDQAFALLAMAAVQKALSEGVDFKNSADALLDRIFQTRRHKTGGFVESAGYRFQSNPHMHLLEAALAWCDVEPGSLWNRLADEIVSLCLAKFVDSKGGFLREFFDENWRPHDGSPGHVVEPGHQFEWAWLLERWGRMRGDDRARAAARKLFAQGQRGIAADRDVAIDELSDDFAVMRATARLWPQTERTKAALILSQSAPADQRETYLREAYAAASALWRYLQTPVSGLWRDKLMPDGTFVEEPAPASSFYHIICCIASLRQTLRD
jgi:mannose-6-phosphate isomerase